MTSDVGSTGEFLVCLWFTVWDSSGVALFWSCCGLWSRTVLGAR